jgi:hypothetical protein
MRTVVPEAAQECNLMSAFANPILRVIDILYPVSCDVKKIVRALQMVLVFNKDIKLTPRGKINSEQQSWLNSPSIARLST